MKHVLILGVTIFLAATCGCGKKSDELVEKTLQYPDGKLREKWHEDRAGLKQGKAYTYYHKRFLFSIDPATLTVDIAALDNRDISAVKTVFADNGTTLTNNAAIQVLTEGLVWAVTDGNIEYLVRLESSTLKIYHESDQVQTESEFRNDYLHGQFVMWDTAGNVIAKCEYRNGEPWSGTAVTVEPVTQNVTFKDYAEGKPVKK